MVGRLSNQPYRPGCVLRRNRAVAGGSGLAQGGGLYTVNVLSIADSVFESNTAVASSAIVGGRFSLFCVSIPCRSFVDAFASHQRLFVRWRGQQYWLCHCERRCVSHNSAVAAGSGQAQGGAVAANTQLLIYGADFYPTLLLSRTTIKAVCDDSYITLLRHWR